MHEDQTARLVSTRVHDLNSSSNIRIWVGEAIRDAIQPLRQILENRLVANEITALYGNPKSGKTFIAVACAVACVTGAEFWGSRFPSDGTVIYVAAERPEQAAERIRAQFLHLGVSRIPDQFILVGDMPTIRLSNEFLVTQLKNLVSIVNPSLIVFDTYVRMTDNDEDKSRDADNNILTLSEIVRTSKKACAGLLVHHGGKDSSKGMRGSSALLAAVTSVWKVTQKAKGRQLTLSMENANSMALADSCCFEIQNVCIPSGENKIQVGIAIQVGGTEERKSRRDYILECLSEAVGAGLMIYEIIASVKEVMGSISESTVRRDLQNLVADGLIEETQIGKRIVYRRA